MMERDPKAAHRLETGYNPQEQAGWFFKCSCGIRKTGLTVDQASHEQSSHGKGLTADEVPWYRSRYEGNTGRREVTQMGFQAVTVEQIKDARSALKGDGESWAKVTVQAFIDSGVDAGILGEDELKSRDGETVLKPESASGMLAAYLKDRSAANGGSIPVVHLTQTFKGTNEEGEPESTKRVILARTDTDAGRKVAGAKAVRKAKPAAEANGQAEAPAEGAQAEDPAEDGSPFDKLENMGASA